jgi:uncharacterized protein YaaR (DUF327 family)
MKGRESIAGLVFSVIDEVINTTESVHSSINNVIYYKGDKGLSDRKIGRRKEVYRTIKHVNSKVEELVTKMLN